MFTFVCNSSAVLEGDRDVTSEYMALKSLESKVNNYCVCDFNVVGSYYYCLGV